MERVMRSIDVWRPATRHPLGDRPPFGGVLLDPHLGLVRPVLPQTPEGCEECLHDHSSWLHLRLCLSCGHVGCCDSSPMRHARVHALALGHPIIRSFEPGEYWRWCYVDERQL
jgi:hypothetical protein